MSLYRIKRGDTQPVQAILKQNGAPVNLAGSPEPVVRFLMKPKPGTVGQTISVTAFVLQGIDGQGRITNKGLVEWRPADVDVDTVGVHDQEWEVTWGNGKKETFPRHGYNDFVIEADLT